MITTNTSRWLSHRSSLKAGGALAVVGAAGIGLGTATRGSAAGPLDDSAYFDLTAPSHDFFDRTRPLHERYRVSQGFAFDNVNRRLSVTQIRNNSDVDDLCISELDRDGKVVGCMHLDDVGHGGRSASSPWVPAPHLPLDRSRVEPFRPLRPRHGATAVRVRQR